jgi:hypothetical protein
MILEHTLCVTKLSPCPSPSICILFSNIEEDEKKLLTILVCHHVFITIVDVLKQIYLKNRTKVRLETP